MPLLEFHRQSVPKLHQVVVLALPFITVGNHLSPREGQVKTSASKHLPYSPMEYQGIYSIAL